MKKIISFLTLVTIMSTLFVSVVRADGFVPTVTTEKEQLTDEEFVEIMSDILDPEEDTIPTEIPSGYSAYKLTVSISDLGNLNCSIKSGKHSGRKLNNIEYILSFGDDYDKINTDYTQCYNCVLGETSMDGVSPVFKTYRTGFSAASASLAYPTTKVTLADASVDDAFEILLVIDNSKDITATLSSEAMVTTYSGGVAGEEEPADTVTMSPDSLTFLASAPSTVDVTGVTVAPKALNLTVGGTGNLTATVAPNDATNKNVTYASSNTSVATVTDAGVVTAVAKGTATITVTTEDGGFTDTCAVTVSLPNVEIKSDGTFKQYNNGTAGQNLAGDDVTIDGNYGMNAFTLSDINTTDYLYKVVAVDSENNEKEFDEPINSKGIELSGATVSFKVMVRSATRVIKNIFIRAVAK